MMNELPDITLPFWMDGPHTKTLARAARNWFLLVAEWASFPLQQSDPRTCSLRMLELLAWQRCITRAYGEPERLYRLRVLYAYANAVDAGQVAGWQRIFKRLGLGTIEQTERVDGQDWDIIGLIVDDSEFPDRQNVLEIIVNDYGRTCRRYRFVFRAVQFLTDSVGIFSDDHCTMTATANGRNAAICGSGAGIFDHHSAIVEVRL